MIKVQHFTTNIKGKKNSLIVRKSNNNIIFSMTDLSTIFSDCGYLLKRIVGGRRRRNAEVLNKMFEWDGTYIT